MIRQILHQLERDKKETRLSLRQLCNGQVPFASFMRWRNRQRRGLTLWQSPGPKKSALLDWSEFYPLLRRLQHGRSRTRGTGELYKQFAHAVSRRELRSLVRDYRQDQLASMKRIDWLWSGLAWSLDATELDGQILIPVQDMASRYRFAPLACKRLDGRQIAAHLEKLFVQHGAPLFLKRGNGSPFNHRQVDEVLRRFGVLPLNNPPHFPRYNGGMEKSIRDFKTALAARLEKNSVASELALAAEGTAHELNHRPRRCLKGRTACAVFHDDAQRLCWTKRQRNAGWTSFPSRHPVARHGGILAPLPGPDRHPSKPKCVNQFSGKLVS
jgi:transposase InsO family protein